MGNKKNIQTCLLAFLGLAAFLALIFFGYIFLTLADNPAQSLSDFLGN